jgi:MFS family permease
VLLGAGTAMVYPTLLAAVGDVAHPRWRASAVGVYRLWRDGGYAVGALLATLAVLAPMLQERARYLTRNETDGTEVMIAVDTEQGVSDAIVGNVKQTGGRVYAGGGLGWGAKFQIGNIPFFAFLNTELIPQASGSYHTAALTADLFPEFDERNAAHYRLFNVRSVVAPPVVTVSL